MSHKAVGGRVFNVASSRFWNDPAPTAVRMSSISVFKERL